MNVERAGKELWKVHPLLFVCFINLRGYVARVFCNLYQSAFSNQNQALHCTEQQIWHHLILHNSMQFLRSHIDNWQLYRRQFQNDWLFQSHQYLRRGTETHERVRKPL